jgi:hypothetical protein
MAGDADPLERFLRFVARASCGLLRPVESGLDLLDQQIDSSLTLIVIPIHGYSCVAITRSGSDSSARALRLL